jgi:hypothetical protein
MCINLLQCQDHPQLWPILWNQTIITPLWPILQAIQINIILQEGVHIRSTLPNTHLWVDLEAVDLEADLDTVDLEADLETVDLQAVDMEALPVEVVDLQPLHVEVVVWVTDN